MAERLDYYKVLRVSKHASQAEIKQAFRRLARQVHPDLNPNNSAAAAQFKQISEAYEVLGDPQRRSHYDGIDAYNPNPSDESPPAAPQRKSSQSLYLQAIEKLSQRDYRGAITDFTEAIALYPGGTEAYLGRCQAYDALKDDRAALEDCYQILQRNPSSAQAYLYQGQARSRLGYPQGAIEAYTKAIALETSFAQAYHRRAQARLELKETVLAYQDLQKAIELYRAQQNLTQAQQAEILMQGLQSPPPAARPKSSSRPFPKGYWTLALGSIPSIVFNPSDNLLPAFARLTPTPAAWTGLLYGLMMVGCLILSREIQQSAPFQYFRVELLRIGLIGCAAYLSLALASGVFRRLARGRGSFAGDFFLAGVAALPMGVVALASGFGLSGLGADILRIIAGCYSVFILYVGCTQISNIDEPRAMVVVPCMILASFGVSAWVANAI